MNYKKIIPNQELRLKLLSLADIIPDKQMIKLQYWIKTGRKLNLEDPKRFTEKLQWYKLYYRNPLMTQCSDKYRVREYIVSKGYKDTLVPLYGVYNEAEEINFNSLPNKFVLKTTNGSHTNILCDDKKKISQEETRKKMNDWLKKRTVKAGREWPYYNIEPKIICEKFLEDENNDLIDYKFVCFKGEIEYVFVNVDRSSDSGLKAGIFSSDFEQLPYIRKEFNVINKEIKKPENYDYMLEIARDLSKDFPHVRVDLYNLNGKVYFGELTFFHGSGYSIFEPDKLDFILGNKFRLPKFQSY